jgi:hypothetical protein
VARKVNGGEDQIADFFGGCIGIFQHRLDLTGFLCDFGENVAGICPVESDAGGLLLKLLRARQCGQCQRYAVQGARLLIRISAFGALSSFDLMPKSFDLIRSKLAGIAKDMRMAPDQFSVIALTTSPKSKRPCSSAIRA